MSAVTAPPGPGRARATLPSVPVVSRPRTGPEIGAAATGSGFHSRNAREILLGAPSWLAPSRKGRVQGTIAA